MGRCDMEKGIITTTIIRIVKEEALKDINDATFLNDTDLVEELGYDSVGIVNLIIRIEEEYEIDLNDKMEELISGVNIGNIVNCVYEMLELKNNE